MAEIPPGVHAAAAAVSEAERVVVLTGAGISTDSGIPDFRGPKGIWTSNPAAEKAATSRTTWPTPRCAGRPGSTGSTRRSGRPSRTVGHAASSNWSGAGRLHAVVTQNVDGLHQEAGNDPDERDRGPRHRAVLAVLGVQRPTSDARDARPGARRRGRSAVSRVRRHREVRHDQLRPVADPRGDRPGACRSATSAT